MRRLYRCISKAPRQGMKNEFSFLAGDSPRPQTTSKDHPKKAWAEPWLSLIDPATALQVQHAFGHQIRLFGFQCLKKMLESRIIQVG